MGYGGTVRCLDCGHAFKAMMGDGMEYSIYRCLGCNEEEVIPNDTALNSHQQKCKICGGALRIDVLPWCPICRSAKTKLESNTMIWD